MPPPISACRYFRSLGVLPAVLVAVEVFYRLSCCAAGASQTPATLHTSGLCGLVSTWEDDGTRSLSNIAQARAMLQAVHDVNTANCTILGPGCEERVRWPGGRLKLDFTLWEQDRTARSTPAAVLRCVEAGNHVIVGPSSTPQTESALMLASVYGTPVIGYRSTSITLFSKQGIYANFARSVPSDAVMVEALIAFMHQMQWKQIAILYKSDAYGYAAEETIVSHARRMNIATESISLGTEDLTSDEKIHESLQQLKVLGHKVVLLVLNPLDVVRTLLAAEESGMNASSYVWTSLSEYSSAYAAIGSRLPPTVAEQLWRLLPGLISPTFPLPVQIAALKDHIVGAQLPDALNSHIRNITGSKVTIPISEKDFHESSNWIDKVPFAGNAYDAVWLIAEAWAKAAQAASKGQTEGTMPIPGPFLLESTTANTDSGNSFPRPSASDLMREITSPGNINFFGVTGNCSWDEIGDRMGADQVVLLTNLPRDVPHQIGHGAESIVFGHYCATGGGLVLDSGRQIYWADGTTYPTIPSDGSPELLSLVLGRVTLKARLDSAAIAVGAVACVVLPLLAYLAFRIRTMKKLVGRIVDETSKTLDLESPLSKMLNLLERLGSGDRRTRPSAAEANELRLLVAANSHNLAAPVSLRRQLHHGTRGPFDQDVANYLVGVTARGGQNDEPDSSLQPRSSSVCFIEFADSDSSGRAPAVQFLERDDSTRRTSAAQHVNLLIPALPSFSKAKSNISHAFARDPFLDLITAGSVIRREVASPLEAVMRHAVALFNLESILGSAEEVNRLLRFTVAIEAGYKDGGYHCKLHAADVTNRMAAIMHMAGLGTRSTRLAALTAGVLHDYEHPQVNNQFLVQTESELAMAFNDQAVAENHSLRSAMQLLRNEAFDFTAPLSSSRPRTTGCHVFRANVIQLVLGTEMSRHFDILSCFNAKVVGNTEIMSHGPGQNKWCAMDDAAQLLTLQVALKVADIGHCALPWDQHLAWLQLLQEEMFAQGDKERQAGIEVSPLMDRGKPGVCVPASQIGFLDIFVLPLVSAFVKVFPECQPLLDQANSNYNLWQEKAAQNTKRVDAAEDV